MNQQDFSYFDPERETVHEPRGVNEDPRESREWQERPEQTGYYVTPEQSMLQGRKLIPTKRTKSYSNWVATAVFLLMLIIGGLIWSIQAPAYSLREYGGYQQPYSGSYHTWHYGHRHHHHHHHHMRNPPPEYQGNDDGNP